jgi:hypothetical protein
MFFIWPAGRIGLRLAEDAGYSLETRRIVIFATRKTLSNEGTASAVP